MALVTKTLDDFVQEGSESWASSLGLNPILQSGDPVLAIVQIASAQALFLQSLIETVNNLTRAQTSTGSDLDSWMSQFNFVRLPATFAQGQVTFSVATANSVAAYINIGTIVQTVGGGIQYAVIADTTQTAYNKTLNQYVLPAGQLSINASVLATVAGTIDNVQANQLVQLGVSIPGIDTVTNTTAIQDGIDTETDANFRLRFINYINSLAKATDGAIISTILNYQQGLKYNVVENLTFGGATQLGYFFAVVDDGSFNPPSTLLTGLQNQINLIRAFTVQQNVYAPTIIQAIVSMAVRVASGYTSNTVTQAVQTALIDYINNLVIGGTLYYTVLIDVAINVPGVVAVKTGYTLNSGTVDVILTNVQEFEAQASNITITTF